MDPHDDQPDSHAEARQRRAAKRRHGMQISGRSTKTVLPDVIARRGRVAGERPHGRLPPTGDDTGPGPKP